MSEPTAAATPAAGAGSPIRRLIDRLAGYDFFVSYAQTQAREYADRLHAELQARGFRTFLDRQVYVAGDELNAATRRRVQASSKLVVVVDEPALRSYWVQQEIEVALDANRPIIAIDLLGDLSARAGQGRTAALLADRIHIREPMDGTNHGPAESTLSALGRSFEATRRDTLRLRLAASGTLFFALLAGFSYWQKTLADDRAEQYLGFCNRVVQMVEAGNRKIDDLRISQFGELIADVTDTLAQLPDPATDPDLRCIPAGS